MLESLRNEGNEMAQTIATSKDTVVSRRTLRKIPSSELHNNADKEKHASIDRIFKSELGTNTR